MLSLSCSFRLLFCSMHAGSSSPAGDRTHALFTGRWSRNHWTAGEVPPNDLLPLEDYEFYQHLCTMYYYPVLGLASGPAGRWYPFAFFISIFKNHVFYILNWTSTWKKSGKRLSILLYLPSRAGTKWGPPRLTQALWPPDVPVASKPKTKRVLTLWLWLPFGRWGCGPKFIPEPEEGDGVGFCVKW